MSVRLEMPPTFGDRRTWRYYTGNHESWWDRIVLRPRLGVSVSGGGWLNVMDEGHVLVTECFASHQWNTEKVVRESDGATLFPIPTAQSVAGE